MRRFFFACLLFLFFHLGAYANHIFGAQLLYTHVYDSLYKITLTAYGDCSNSNFTNLRTSKPLITIYRSGTFYSTLSLIVEDSSGTEVSPVCPDQRNNTACHSGGTLPGVKQFIYSAYIVISPHDANWRFVFAGEFQNGSVAGRAAAITNVYSAGGSIIYLQATLNNTTGYNSSPAYTSIPTPYYCINVIQQYNQGASDADGDSLSFDLTSALTPGSSGSAASGTPVSYISPYTYSNPLSADTFSFNSLNGQLFFKPNAIQDGLVVTQVSEYRKGVLVGTSMREMTFIVLNNCDNSPSNGALQNVTSGYASGNIISICQGTPNVSFTINVTDPDGDFVKIIPAGIPATASFSVSGDSTANPKINFSWKTDTLPPGIYNIFITYQDNHCPISSKQTIAYTIRVVPPYSISSGTFTPTQCTHKAYVELDIANGISPMSVIIDQGTNAIDSLTDTTGVIKDSLAAGNYTIRVSAPNATCPISYNFSVVDSGALPLLNLPVVSYCRYAPSTQLTLGGSASVQWYDANMNPLSTAPTPSTTTPGNFVWYFTRNIKVCKSNLDTVQVEVHELPDIQIIGIPTSVCLGDKLYLQATGGTVYQWHTDNNELFTDRNTNAIYTILMDTATYTVSGTNGYGCYDSASTTISTIGQCCQVACPNAFSPNHDGRNDRYHVVTYGNMKTFELMIYNRWGQLVYISDDQHGSWDGTFNGIPCEIGTYFYMLKATCLTGHSTEQKGDITLIR